MNKKRITALLTAAVLPLSLSSCKLRDFGDVVGKKSGSGDTYLLYSGEKAPTVDDVRNDVKKLVADLKKDDRRQDVADGIKKLLYDMDALHEALALVTVDYYRDWNNKKLNDRYDAAYENYYVANYLVNYAFAHGYKNETYSDMFKDYIGDEESVEYFTSPSLSLKRLEGYAKVDYDVRDEQLENYYDIINDDDLSKDEKNLKCAELYLDVLSSYDPESFYDGFNRDYSPERIMELSRCVREKLLPASKKLETKFTDSEKSKKVMASPKTFKSPFDVVLKYSPKLSPDIEKAAKQLVDEKLYSINKGKKCFTGSYTDELPVSGRSYIYIYDYEDYSSLITPVHEFGHFYASSYVDTPSMLNASNMDIAEIQSQGFEVVFSRFYDEIYGSDSDVMKTVTVCDMADSVVTGFFVGEFEYKVLQNRDKYTPEDVVKCFHEIFDAYNPDVEFYYIQHIFEQPGYYISYGVSALAAFEIWQDSLYDPDEALEKYEKIAHVSYGDKKNTFCSALKSCGFNDVLNEKYIETLAEELSDLAEELE